MVNAFVYAIGQNGFLYFSLVTALRGEQEGFGDLLGDRAAPLDNRAGFYIFNECPDDAEEIDPLVLVKPGIFSGDEGLLKLHGNL